MPESPKKRDEGCREPGEGINKPEDRGKNRPLTLTLSPGGGDGEFAGSTVVDEAVERAAKEDLFQQETDRQIKQEIAEGSDQHGAGEGDGALQRQCGQKHDADADDSGCPKAIEQCSKDP